MTTEKTDNNDRPAIRGWVGYDGDCGLCAMLVRRCAGPFERRGFVFLPLQNPWLAGRLGLKDGEMPEEMKLLMAGGHVVGGAESIVVLLRAVGWLAPLAWLAWLPGLQPLTVASYRWVARNRHALGICRVPERPARPHHGHAAFFEAP